MKKFIFKFATVLKVKERKEEQLKRELMHLQGLKVAQEQHLEKTIQRRIVANHEKTLVKKEGAQISKLLEHEAHLNMLRSMIEETKIKIKEISKMVDNKRKEVVEASREKKIIEKLKERDFEKFKREVEQHEQKQLDEVAISKYNRKEQHNF